MTERKKLIELLKSSKLCSKRFDDQYSDETIAVIADYLIENGVVLVDTNCVKRENLPLVQQAFNMPLDKLAEIVSAQKESRLIIPPCKVGDTVYQLDSVGDIYKSEVTQVIYNTKGIAFDERAIGKYVFLTREEAEKALTKIIENK